MAQALLTLALRYLPMRIWLGFRRLVDIARSTDDWQEEAALARIARNPRLHPGVATLRGLRLQYVDPLSFASQFRAIFQQGCYQFHAAPTRSTPLILDCGANIGLATIYWKHLFPEARVLAFEPDSSGAQVLRTNLSFLNISGVEVIEAAVWTENGNCPFESLGADVGRLGP